MTSDEQIAQYERLFKKGQLIDGVVDAPKYFSSPIRIAWLLKEAYTDEPDGWHIKNVYGGPGSYENFFRYKARPTWHPIIYASYGIHNGYLEWNDMPYIKDNPAMCEVVSSIAIINANKFPSKTGRYTLYKNLEEGFKECMPIIDEQLRILRPEVCIFGNTFPLYKSYFQIEERDLVDEIDGFKTWRKGNQLLIDAYHPMNTKMSKEKYVDYIVNAAHDWKETAS